MTIKKGELIELKIDSTAFGGRGFTKIDGLAVFVEGAIPYDIVSAKILKKKKSHMEARAVEIIKPSPFRKNPPCQYSGFCGGCKWQFLNYAQQLEYKKQHIIDALEHIGFVKGVMVHNTIPSDLVFGYRNKMEFSCSDKRWLLPEELGKENTDKGFALGLHVPGTYDKIIDIDKCLLQPELGNNILSDVRDYIRKSIEPVYGIRSHSGFWRYVVLRNSMSYNEWMVNLVTSKENKDEVQPLADKLSEKYPHVVSVVNNITSRKAGVAMGEYEILLHGKPFIKDTIGKFDFEISANSFFQTNTRGAEKLYKKALEYCRLSGQETVFDLYSGTGAIAIYLSKHVQEVIGIEITKSAVDDAERNCLINNVSNCHFIQGDIRQSLSDMGNVPNVLVIDPPRSGMHKDVVKQVVETGVEQIVYVSCNPSTLARDICTMKEHYHVLEVQPVDMFPQTYHIEAVCRMERKKAIL